jgi:hypothetical protein
MKKKLFLLLLIVALTAFVFTGCTPPAEGEGEGEGEIEGVLVEIDGSVELNGRTYVAGGDHVITVTFPAPVANVNVYISDCAGDYGKQPIYYYYGRNVVLWPNADKTVWTGSGSFVCDVCETGSCAPKTSNCCASYVQVVAGECEGNVCVSVPVVVDCGKPYAQIEVTTDDCCCETCSLVFKSKEGKDENPCDSCAAGKDCCGDNCSGLASWQVDLYTVKNATWANPGVFFDDCCGITPCAELVDTCTGTECPIKCETKCLDAGTENAPAVYFAVIKLEDNVGQKQTYYGQIGLWHGGSGTDTAEKCRVQYREICCGEDVLCPTTSATPIGACSDTDTCVKPY